MTTSDDLVRNLCLKEELGASMELLKSGFGHLQEIDMGTTFYHLPHQLMASGFERLMKCYLALVHKGRHGTYPNQGTMKSLGHDLETLLKRICTQSFGGTHRPLVADDFQFITNDNTLKECIRILSLFGQQGRYYNLDIVAGVKQPPIDPRSEWQKLEASVEDPVPYLNDPESMYRDYFPRVHSLLIGKMERLIRAIAIQFTLGGHADASGEMSSLSILCSDFSKLRDDEFGTIDYRRSVEILKQDQDTWVRRSENEITESRWPTLVLNRADFQGDWPFRKDRVILECRRRLFCIINVDGYAFALNGAARSHFRFPNPHEAGVAILGKSIGPFIEEALELPA